MKFLSPEAALYIYKSTVQYCMEYCFHGWAGGLSYYLKLLDKLQKTYLGLLSKCSQPSCFCRYYFGRRSSELAQLVPLPYSWGKSICYSDRLHDFSVTIPRCYKDVYVNSFFPHTARLWNSLPIECFSLTYDLKALSLELNDTYYL